MLHLNQFTLPLIGGAMCHSEGRSLSTIKCPWFFSLPCLFSIFFASGSRLSWFLLFSFVLKSGSLHHPTNFVSSNYIGVLKPISFDSLQHFIFLSFTFPSFWPQPLGRAYKSFKTKKFRSWGSRRPRWFR